MLKKEIEKLEVANEVRRKEALDKENKRRVLENVFVDLVRIIRQRRSPQMAQKIMIKLLENQEKREKIHKELIAKTKEKDQRTAIMKQIQRELLDKVQSRRPCQCPKGNDDKVKEWEVKQIKKSVSVDIMKSLIEKPTDEDDFLPRKLFFFGVETFSVLPKTNIEAKPCIREMMQKEMEMKCEDDDGHQCPPPKKTKFKALPDDVG